MGANHSGEAKRKRAKVRKKLATLANKKAAAASK